jgi:hypothetical protein
MSRLEVPVASGSLIQLYEALYGPMYEAVLNIIGSTGTILPLGDPKHGQPNATTFKTVGEEQVTFTWSEAPNSFDTSLDLTDPDSFQGIAPILTFNGTDEEADTPDAAYWSRDDSGTNPFSIGAWAYVTDTAADRTILAKWDTGTSDEEWNFRVDGSDKLSMLFRDDSAAVQPTRVSDAAINMATWAFFVATYDSAGGSSAMDTVTLYQDGTALASTSTNEGSYVAMEDGTSKVTLGMFNPTSTPTGFFNGKMAGGPLGPFFTQKELTADEVKRLYELGRRSLAL